MSSNCQSICETEYSNDDKSQKTYITSKANDEYSNENNYLVKSIAEILDEIIDDFEGIKSKNKEKLDIFYCSKQPKISLFEYLKRFVRYTKVEESTLICSLIYLDRLCDLKSMHLTKNNVHKLLLGALVLAIKFNEDDYYSNDFYAKVGGLSNGELNQIESQALYLHGYQLHIDAKIFFKYHDYLKQYKIAEDLYGN